MALEERKYDAALIFLNKILELDPLNAEAKLCKGEIYHRCLQDYARAIEQYNKVLRITGEQGERSDPPARSRGAWPRSWSCFRHSGLSDHVHGKATSVTPEMSSIAMCVRKAASVSSVARLNSASLRQLRNTVAQPMTSAANGRAMRKT